MTKPYSEKPLDKTKIGSSFIYTTVDSLLELLQKINLVEYFKKFAINIIGAKKSQEDKITYSRIAVDIFISSKWLLIIIPSVLHVTSNFLTFVVWYLQFSNLYTYFYYHCWSTKSLTDPHFDIYRFKRRFLTLSLSVLYSTFGFAYLYYLPYRNEFTWYKNTPSFLHSLWFSISNSLTANYTQISPSSNLGNSISMIQLVIMFAFISIVLGSSIPSPGTYKKEDPNGL